MQLTKNGSLNNHDMEMAARQAAKLAVRFDVIRPDRAFRTPCPDSHHSFNHEQLHQTIARSVFISGRSPQNKNTPGNFLFEDNYRTCILI